DLWDGEVRSDTVVVAPDQGDLLRTGNDGKGDLFLVLPDGLGAAIDAHRLQLGVGGECHHMLVAPTGTKGHLQGHVGGPLAGPDVQRAVVDGEGLPTGDPFGAAYGDSHLFARPGTPFRHSRGGSGGVDRRNPRDLR